MKCWEYYLATSHREFFWKFPLCHCGIDPSSVVSDDSPHSTSGAVHAQSCKSRLRNISVKNKIVLIILETLVSKVKVWDLFLHTSWVLRKSGQSLFFLCFVFHFSKWKQRLFATQHFPQQILKLTWSCSRGQRTSQYKL